MDLAFTDSEVYDNEAYVHDHEDDDECEDSEVYADEDNDVFEDNDIEKKSARSEFDTRRNDDTVTKQLEDHNLYLRSVEARKQILLADVHSEEMDRESDNEIYNSTDLIRTEIEKEVIEEEEESVGIEEKERVVTGLGIKSTRLLHKGERLLPTPPIGSVTIRQVQNHRLVSHKPHFLKPISKIEMESETVTSETPMKQVKHKKKKRGILTRSYGKKSVSLSVGNSDMPTFYSKPRRGSEPPLFLYDVEAADPKDSKLYTKQNKILYNPYYTEISMPLNENQKRRSCTAEDMHEVDVFQKQNLNRERSMPIADEIYDKHVPASTWM